MTEPQPSVGRIVHTQHPDFGCIAAIVVLVPASARPGEVTLYRFPHPNVPDGLLVSHPHDPAGSPHTWHWPERA